MNKKVFMNKMLLPVILLAGCMHEDTSTEDFSSIPFVASFSVTTEEETPVKLELVISDREDEVFEVFVVKEPLHGYVSGNYPEVYYYPDADYLGSDQFDYKVTDGEYDSGVATVSITIIPVIDAPIVSSFSATTDEDTPVKLALVISDTEDEEFEAFVVDEPSHGYVSGDYPEIFYYPDTDYTGSDQFDYKVSDGVYESGTATVSITVNPINDGPYISGQPETNILAYEEYSFTPTANDPENDAYSFSIENKPDWLEFSSSTGTLSGVPTNEDVGTDIVISVSDGSEENSLAAFSILVEAIEWEPRADMPAFIAGHSTVTVDDVIYLVGGRDPDDLAAPDSIFAYFAGTDTWEERATLPTTVSSTRVASVDGLIYVINGSITNGTIVNLVQIYNPETDSWSSGTPMDEARAGFAISTYDGKVYVIGGFYKPSLHAPAQQRTSTLVYDPTLDNWTTKADVPLDSAGGRATTLNDEIYLIGANYPTKEVYIYDPIADKWSQGASINHPRREHAVETVDGKIYLIGGSGQVWPLDQFNLYDPNVGEWIYKTGIPDYRFGHSSATIDGNIYIFGGTGLVSPPSNYEDIVSVKMYNTSQVW